MYATWMTSCASAAPCAPGVSRRSRWQSTKSSDGSGIVPWLDIVLLAQAWPPGIRAATPELSWIQSAQPFPVARRLPPFLAYRDKRLLRGHVRGLAWWSQFGLGLKGVLDALSYDFRLWLRSWRGGGALVAPPLLG